MVNKVPGLERISERNPGEITEGKHEAKSICSYVHGRQDSSLIVKSIPNVQSFENIDSDHRQRNVAEVIILFKRASKVQNGPADKTWPEFAENLKVNLANPWVELSPDKEIVDIIAALTSFSKLHLFLHESSRIQVH